MLTMPYSLLTNVNQTDFQLVRSAFYSYLWSDVSFMAVNKLRSRKRCNADKKFLCIFLMQIEVFF